MNKKKEIDKEPTGYEQLLHNQGENLFFLLQFYLGQYGKEFMKDHNPIKKKQKGINTKYYYGI